MPPVCIRITYTSEIRLLNLLFPFPFHLVKIKNNENTHRQGRKSWELTGICSPLPGCAFLTGAHSTSSWFLIWAEFHTTQYHRGLIQPSLSYFGQTAQGYDMTMICFLGFVLCFLGRRSLIRKLKSRWAQLQDQVSFPGRKLSWAFAEWCPDSPW